MLVIRLRPPRANGQVAVDITRPGSDFLVSTDTIAQAVTFLTNHGCCPGAAAMLFDLFPCAFASIGEPQDLPDINHAE